MTKKIERILMSVILMLSILMVCFSTGCKNVSSDDQEEANTVSLYIGYDANGYDEYEVEIEGEVTPDKLIGAIADLTGWNLTLKDKVSVGKGGMTINFDQDSSLVTGPPAEQKEEFRAYDIFSFTDMMLDSIKETLQRFDVSEPGNPDNLDIYYLLDDKEIVIDGVSIPMDKPWESGRLYE